MPLNRSGAPRPRHRWLPDLRALAALTALLIGGLLASAGPAVAHAELVSCSPADGSVIAREPLQVTLAFSEDVTVRLSSVRVIGPDGRRLDRQPPQAVPPGDRRIAVGLAPETQQGTYVLEWLATAADDGHATSGTLSFSVGAPSRTPVGQGLGTPDRVTDAVLDTAVWLGFAGLALLVGSAVIRRCAPQGRDPAPPAPSLRRAGSVGWAVLLAGTVVQLFVHGPATQGEAVARITDRALLGATLSTREGHLLIARIVLLALVATIGDPLLRHRRGAVPAVLLVLGLAATWSGTSHASSGSLVPLSLAVTTLHVTAFAVWAGGLSGLLVLSRGSGSGLPPLTVTRFSRVALTAVAVLAATGLYQAFREIGRSSELTGTWYGRLLLVKTVIVVLVVLAASVTRRYALRPDSGPPTVLRRAALLELVGVTAVLLVTVLLIGQPPPR
ncbi:copper resistance CopC/CopD family protein [Streptacidiphilus rugosus]|uniref:copper resistance CopC/CopD family protein n=1 Tax=Streptacidiphilus rugosus TaxID=405783 RepID=UPI00068F0C37|nr:copper resistance protein CopC [Streptacidiphilus rugosus]